MLWNSKGKIFLNITTAIWVSFCFSAYLESGVQTAIPTIQDLLLYENCKKLSWRSKRFCRRCNAGRVGSGHWLNNRSFLESVIWIWCWFIQLVAGWVSHNVWHETMLWNSKGTIFLNIITVIWLSFCFYAYLGSGVHTPISKLH